jgi:hypothetical protein
MRKEENERRERQRREGNPSQANDKLGAEARKRTASTGWPWKMRIVMQVLHVNRASVSSSAASLVCRLIKEASDEGVEFGRPR